MSPRRAFTLLELLVVGIVVLALVGLFLVFLNSQRELARRAGCSMKIHCLAIAVHNYHDTLHAFPAGCGGLPAPPRLPRNYDMSWGVLMPLFPYIESNAVYQMYIIVAWNEISDKPSGTMYPPFYDSEVAAIDASVEFGPKPPLENRDAVLQDLYGRTQDAFICPSDPHARDPMGTKDWKEIKLYPNARRNYVWCRGDWIGDSTRNNTTWGQRSRGLFGVGVWYGFKDCHDGTSNTLLFSERCSPKDVSTTTLRGGATRMSGDDKFKTPERCLAAGERGKLKRDATYLDVYPETAIMFDGRLFGGFSTILSPNSPSCVQGDSKDSARFGYGIASASSYHPGGVHVVLADASCRFINDDIDAGFASKAPVEYGVSPYGVWGELGNRSQTETPPKPSID